MTKRPRSRLAPVVATLGLCGAFLATPAARGQDAPPGGGASMSPGMRADVESGLAYRLPSDFMSRAMGTVESLRSAQIAPPDSSSLTLQQTIDRVSATPGVPQILSAHGFTPRDFVLGLTAFGMTVAIMHGQKPPAGFPSPDPGNIALLKAHPAETARLMQAMGMPPSSTP